MGWTGAAVADSLCVQVARLATQYGDPTQMIRVVGAPAKLHADAEQHFYHENPDHL